MPKYTQCCHRVHSPCVLRTEHRALQGETENVNTTTVCRGRELVGSLVASRVSKVNFMVRGRIARHGNWPRIRGFPLEKKSVSPKT